MDVPSTNTASAASAPARRARPIRSVRKSRSLSTSVAMRAPVLKGGECTQSAGLPQLPRLGLGFRPRATGEREQQHPQEVLPTLLLELRQANGHGIMAG